MYLTSTLQRALIIGGIAVLAVVCVVALTHRTSTANAAYENTALPAQAPLNQYGNPEPVAPPPSAQPAGGYNYEPAPAGRYASAPGYGANPGYAGSAPAPAYGYAGYAERDYRYSASAPGYNSSAVVYAPSPFGSEYVSQPAPPPPAAVEERVAPQPEYQRRYYYHHGRRVMVVERRPFSHSAAIVGGSAAGGAAIGAIAGGGEGAAIGALAGGAGGFVYDRLTHKKKRVVVEER